ncbi:MAG: hypothetical protein F6K54_01570 [Okeania sp. SIO3B5]|uniref:hypothetical protein n=1 Tax=Okeania sp. SIO3B5 TaxID=2607811 RepID=UPI001400BA51|nr:hypothetical protein [Okeania sp. SIO3B5]NEO51891.1 hypothetical protein [Okeania sp. SIO3B5]
MKPIKANLSFLENSFRFESRGEGQHSYIFTNRQQHRLTLKSSIPNPFDGEVVLGVRMVFGKNHQSEYPVGVELYVCGVDELRGHSSLARGGVMLEKFEKCAYLDIDSLGENNRERILFVASLPSTKPMGDSLQVIVLSDSSS